MTETDDLLAAEYVLGLLGADELAEAERRVAADSAFAERVDWWRARFGALFAGVEPVPPSDRLWDLIGERLDRDGRPSNIRPMDGRLRFWRAYGAAATAIAAALLVGLATTWRPETRPTAPVPAPVARSEPLLVANVVAEDRTAAFVVTVEADRRRLLVTPALAQAERDRDFQLWLLGPDGTPVSLGVLASPAPSRLPLAGAIAPGLREDVTLAVSVEPRGGSPTGLPTGPVIATGPLRRV